jgi:hypothetical protein
LKKETQIFQKITNKSNFLFNLTECPPLDYLIKYYKILIFDSSRNSGMQLNFLAITCREILDDRFNLFLNHPFLNSSRFLLTFLQFCRMTLIFSYLPAHWTENARLEIEYLHENILCYFDISIKRKESRNLFLEIAHEWNVSDDKDWSLLWKIFLCE